MKKMLTLALVMATATAFGDIAIKWNDNIDGQAPTLTSDSLALLPAGNYAALIWSASVPTTADEVNTDGLATGEFLLDFYAVGLGGSINKGTALYVDADVGDVDINNGYFFTRIYDVGTLEVAGTGFYRQSAAIGSSLTEYPGGPLPTTPTVAQGYADPAFGTFGPVNNAYTVVPEPATIGLFGLGALSAWIIRRNKQKATEEA